MRFPRGSASTLLSLAAGLLTAAAVASAWVPFMRQAGKQDAEHLATQLALTATMAAEQFNRDQVVPFDSATPGPGGMVRDEVLERRVDRLIQISGVDLVVLLGREDEVLYAASDLGQLDPEALGPLTEQCHTKRVLEGEVWASAPFTLAGDPVQAGCAPLYGGDGQAAGLLAVVQSSARRAMLDRVRLRATALMAGLGSLAGLVVIFGVRWLLSPIQEVSEAARRIAASERGVTVEPRGPEEIAQLARAVNALASSIAAREDEIRGRLSVVTELSSMVAHEVRNPLQSLSLLCTLARTETDEDARNQLLGNIEAEIHGLEGVVQRFLRNSGPLQISRTDVELVEILRRAAAVAEPEARSRKVNLIVQAPGRLEVSVDGSLVRRAMENLLLNAIEFASQHPPGHVTASVIPKADQVVLIVDDDGPGVKPEDRERIFQPYFSSKSGGTGLGLALVKQVFEAHGGYIRCGDSPMGGARFEAILPLEVAPRGDS